MIEGNLGDYPSELLQLRLQAIQEHLSKHHPSTAIYIASLGAVLVITITLIATCLALHVSDGKPWVLGVIVIMILVFISKMSFLSRIEKVQCMPFLFPLCKRRVDGVLFFHL